jgi:hypothetical protein
MSEIPNQSTARKAQEIAGKVRSTMIQLSKKLSTERRSPMTRPMEAPMSIDRIKPTRTLSRVLPITR